MEKFVDIKKLRLEIKEYGMRLYKKIQEDDLEISQSFDYLFKEPHLTRYRRNDNAARIAIIFVVQNVFSKVISTEELGKIFGFKKYQILPLIDYRYHEYRLKNDSNYRNFYYLLNREIKILPSVDQIMKEVTFETNFDFKYVANNDYSRFSLGLEHYQKSEYFAELISDEVGISKTMLKSRSRKEEPFFGRTIQVVLLYNSYPTITLKALACLINRDHATVINCIKTHQLSFDRMNWMNHSAQKYRNFLGSVLLRFKLS